MKRMTMALVVLALLPGLGSSAWAQLPTGWSQTDIGGAWPAGGASYDQATGTWTVTGDGADIWDAWDAFHFVYRRLRGDGKMTARVVSITGAGLHEWAKAGVMIRETLDANSGHAMTAMNPGRTQNHAAQFAWRATTGGLSDHVASGSMALPYWVRIERIGNTFRSYISPNGSTWTQQGTTQTISMDQDVYIGLLVLSHVAGQLSTDTFDNVTIQGDLIEEVPARAITYQGRLSDGDLVADGLYDVQFRLYDAPSGGNQKGGTVAIEDIDVVGGYFTADLDFGEGVFDGSPRWLQIAVRPGASTGSFTILDPRQRVAPTPYALYAFSGADNGSGGDGVTAPLVLSSSGTSATIEGINTGTGPAISGSGSSGAYGMLGVGEYGVYGESTNGYAGYFDGDTYFSGNVGIGTSNPSSSLHVEGGRIAAYGTAGSETGQIDGRTEGNGYGVYGQSSSGTGVYGKGHIGVFGFSPTGDGVTGHSLSGKALNGYSDTGYAVYGYAPNGYAGFFVGPCLFRYALEVSMQRTGPAIFVNGDEAIWYDGTYFSWGFGGQRNYFADPVGIGTTTPKGALDVNGEIYQRGVRIHADYVFEPGYNLESIDAHSQFMWKNKHLKAIPKAEVDENGREVIEVGSDRKGIVEELEKAHIYIGQLHTRVKTLEEQKDTAIARLQEQVSELTARLERLEAMISQISNNSFERAQR